MRRTEPTTGSVTVVGLGPGDAQWMTPQSRRELAAATDLIGYGPYLDRVAGNTGQHRHPSDNTDEPERARLACELASQGRSVAVVSSGDPGVFAMATAVLEECAKLCQDVIAPLNVDMPRFLAAETAKYQKIVDFAKIRE